MSKMACNSKTAGGRAKRTEIWQLGDTGNTYIWSTFDLVEFKVIWGSFSALISEQPVTRTQIVVERNKMKFRIWGR